MTSVFTPTFAVVGHPNKGKSSIVATLAEDERVAISNAPGTTRNANAHSMRMDDQVLYVLVDTPGFQRAREVLDWLEARATSASERPAAVAQFVREHESDERFHDECELLKPILAGAGILYVVDGAKPYGREYELEMQILQWTGSPRMALINMIGSDDYSLQWRQALDQYFSIVRSFDAMNADFDNRIGVLRAFAELDERWREPLERTVGVLNEERQRRRLRSAREIAGFIADALSMSERETLVDSDEPGTGHEQLKQSLTQRLQQRIVRREQTARDNVQSIYRWGRLELNDSTGEILATDLFASEGWELFGLSETKLLISGLVSGALAGGGVDALLGGASMLLGAGIGALLGGAGAWFGGHELAKVKVLGETLGGKVLQVGPVSAPNFPWVLLGRAWVHHHLISERNHARREAVSVSLIDSQHLMDVLPDDVRKLLTRLFKVLAQGGDDEVLKELGNLLDQDLATDPGAAVSGP